MRESWPTWLRVGAFSASTLGFGAGGCHVGQSAPLGREPSFESKPPPSKPRALWVSHSASGMRPIFDAALPDGSRLYILGSGTRWVLDGTGRPLAGPLGSPEPMTGARFEGGRLELLARSGRTYSASGATGTLSLATSIGEPFVSSAWGGTRETPTLLGLGANGSLSLSSDLGHSWQKERSDRYFVSVRSGREGEFFLDSLPEAHFRFRAPRGWDELAKKDTSETPSPTLGPSVAGLPRLPSAMDLGALGAMDAISGEIFLLQVSADARHTEALRGRIGEPLTPSMVRLPGDCRPKRVAVSEGTTVVLCEQERVGADSLFEVVSSVSGAPFQRRGVVRVPQESEVAVSVGPSGQVALSGVCAPRESEPGCTGQGVYLLDARGSGRLRVPVPLVGRPLGFAFAADGALFSVYQRLQDDHLFAIRFLDGTLRSLDLSQTLHLAPQVETSVSIIPGSLGVTGFVLTQGTQHMVLCLGRELELLGVGSVPEGATHVSGAGSRVLALDTRLGRAWESQNGGLSFQSFDLPEELASADHKPLSLACAAPGCLIGADYSRLGWGVPNTDSRADNSRLASELPSRLLFRCEVTSEEIGRLTSVPTAYDAARGQVAWSELQVDRERAQVSVVHAPYGQSELRVVELLQASLDPGREALFVSAQVEGSGALRYRIPTAEGKSPEVVEVAWDNRFDDAVRRELITLTDAETEFRRQALTPRPADFERGGARTYQAKPWFFSISPKVVYVGLHARADARDGVLVAGDVSGGRVLSLPSVLLDPKIGRGQFEVIRDGAEDVPFVMTDSGRVLVLQVGPSAVKSFRLGPTTSPWVEALAGVAYRGDQPEFSVRMDDPAGTFSSAYRVSVSELRKNVALGMPVPSRRVPSALEVSETTRPCSAADRSTTARGVFPEPETRHFQADIEVSPGTYVRFKIVRSVIFGEVGNPCLAMFEAEPELPLPPSLGSYPHRVLIDPSPDGTSFRFSSPQVRPSRSTRTLTRPPSSDEGISVVALRCSPPSLSNSEDQRTR